jgi:hypothetical protein
MNARALVMTWLLALGLCVMMAAAPVLLVERIAQTQRSDIVVIGSSLMAHAVPATGQGATSLLGDQRSHRRIATRRLTENDLLGYFEQAISQHTALVFIEVNPLLVDFADQLRQRPCDGLRPLVKSYVVATRRRVPESFAQLAGLPLSYGYAGDPANLDSPHSMTDAVMRSMYPLRVREPCFEPELAAAISRAKAQGTAVVLVLPPRSPDADLLLGSKLTSQLRDQAMALAARLEIPLVVIDGNWHNEEFVDAAHLNVIGRQHFLRELRQRWASTQ